MNWLILLFALELSFIPNYESLNAIYPHIEVNVNENIEYTLLEAEIIIGNIFFIGGTTKTNIQLTNVNTYLLHFEPDYLINAGLKFGILKIGYRQLCLYPIQPYEIIYQPKDSNKGYKEFYIRISNKY